MDNRPDDNIDIDKYTNYTYQVGTPSAPPDGSYSAPAVNTYSAPELEPLPPQNASAGGQFNPYASADPANPNNSFSQYANPQGQYGQTGQYSQPGPYSQSDPYAQPGQYSQPQSAQYNQPVRYTQPGQYEQYIYNGGGQTSTSSAPGKGPSIASMICGIASICTFSFIPGIIALCLSKNFRRSNNGKHNSFSKAGKICGIVGIVLSVIFIFVYIILIANVMFEAADTIYF